MLIKAAAIKDSTGKIHTLPPPARHYNIIKQMASEGIRISFTDDVQGFILEDGTFVDRYRAALIACKNGQCNASDLFEGKLTTQDLW